MKPETQKKLDALKQSNPDLAELLNELIKDKEIAEGKAAKQQKIAMDAVTSLEFAKSKQAASSAEERNLARQIASKQLAEARQAPVSIAEELRKQQAQKQVKVTGHEARDQGIYEGKMVDGLMISVNGVKWFLPQDIEVEVPESVAQCIKDRAADMKLDSARRTMLQSYQEYNNLNMGWQR